MAVGNSGDVIISQTSFYGGMGTDNKIGIKNSYANSESMDARKNPSVMTVLPGSRKIIDNDIQGLIVSMTQTPDGKRWGIATNGELYQIDESNNITKVATLPNWVQGTHGDLAYWPLTDSLYVTGADRVYRYTPVIQSGTSAVTTITGSYSTYPTMAQILVRDRDNKWVGNGTSRWTFLNGSSGTYSVPTSITENATHSCIFLPDQSPLTAINLRFRAKPGSGTVTITIHDGQNKVIATSTLATAAVSTSGVTTFTFPQTELGEYKNFGTEYHLHVTASTSGFTVDTYEGGLLYGLHFYFFAALLLNTRKKYHPIWNWAGSKLLIGNGQYLVDWLPSGLDAVDASEFKRHAVIVENGMEITSLTSNDEYVVLGCEKVGNNNTRPFQQGMLGFWDGFADAINFKIDTPMGEPKSLYTYQNITYINIAGSLYVYTGSKALAKVRTIQDSQSEYTGVRDNTDIFTHCMAVRRGILLMVYPSTTNLKTMRHGVYSYGSVDVNYPNSFYYSYDIPEATGNYNTEDHQLTIGGIWNYADTLYFSYYIQDNSKTIDLTDVNLWESGIYSVSDGSKENNTGKARLKNLLNVTPGSTMTVRTMNGVDYVFRGYDASGNFVVSFSTQNGSLYIPTNVHKLSLWLNENPAQTGLTFTDWQNWITSGVVSPVLDFGTYNIAIVDNDSLPARKFEYESLTFDGGMPWKDKEVLRAVASFDPLPEGCKIKLKYKIDNRPWQIDTREATEGDTDIYFEINKRFREIQFGFEGTNEGTAGTPARITSVGINVRELGEEGKMHR